VIRVPRPVEDACFLQLYTSGTTGRPKGAMLTGANLTAQVVTLGAALSMDSGSVSLSTVPVFHNVSMVWALTTMYHSGSVVVVRDIDPSAVLDEIAGRKVTHVALVPTLRFLCDARGCQSVTGVPERRAQPPAHRACAVQFAGTVPALACAVSNRGVRSGRCWPVSNDRPGANRRPRGPGGTRPGRTSTKRNVTTPMGSGRPGLPVGRT